MYQKLQSQIYIIEEKLKTKTRENPSGFYFLLKTKLLFVSLVFEFVKYFILLFNDPAKSFILFKNQESTILGTCPYSYYEYKDMHKKVKIFSFYGAGTIVLVAVLSSLITNLFFGSWFPVKAATYTFTQTNWNTLSSNTAAHATDQSNWTQYSATSTWIAASSTVMVAASTTTWTVTDDGTTDTGFNNAGAATSSATVSGTGSGANVILTSISGLVGLWHMNEGSGQTVSDSKGTNTGTLGETSDIESTDAVWTTSGKFSNALSFDGVTDDRINVGNGASLNITTAITLEAWIKPNNIAIDWQRIISKNETYVLGISAFGGVYLGLWNTSGVQTYINGGTALSQGSWNHVVGTWDGTTMKIYLNGVLQTETAAFSGPIITTSIPVRMGADGDNLGNAFNGIIDEAAIYNRELSTSEITARYNAGTGVELPYPSSGTFTSHIYDTTGNTSLGTLSWTATTPSGTSVAIKVRSGNQSNLSDATAWGSCTNIASGSALSTGGCVTNGHQYIQFQAALSTTDTAQTPTLSDVSITYTNYSTTTQTLTSSAYDSGSAANLISKITWSTTTPPGTDVKFQMRSATTSADLTWHN